MKQTMCEIGHEIPYFRCPAVGHGGRLMELDSKMFSGRYLVLFFYPFNNGIVRSAMEFDQRRKEFEEKSCDLLGCSVDSVLSHCAHTEGKLHYPLLGDVSCNVARSYGMLTDSGSIQPGVFIIDDHQILRAKLPTSEASIVLEVLQQIQLTRAPPRLSCKRRLRERSLEVTFEEKRSKNDTSLDCSISSYQPVPENNSNSYLPRYDQRYIDCFTQMSSYNMVPSYSEFSSF